jgi:hypothetical protein
VHSASRGQCAVALCSKKGGETEITCE